MNTDAYKKAYRVHYELNGDEKTEIVFKSSESSAKHYVVFWHTGATVIKVEEV